MKKLYVNIKVSFVLLLTICIQEEYIKLERILKARLRVTVLLKLGVIVIIKRFSIFLLFIFMLMNMVACSKDKTKSTFKKQYNLGVRYLSEGNYKEAVIVFKIAIKINPKSVPAYIGLADAHIGLGEKEKAIEVLKQGYEATGSNKIKDKLDKLNKVDETFVSGVNYNEDYVIKWKDRAFEAMVRLAINKPEGDIWRSELDNIFILKIRGNYAKINSQDFDVIDYINYGGITTLDDVVNFKNLEGLEVSINKVSDISALKNKTNLIWLALSSNEISDISALANFSNLVSLSLCQNNVSDINILENLPNLVSLWLKDNNINDISVLKYLTNLNHLHIDDNKINDINVLMNLTNLENLGIGDNNISDISILKNLTNLKSLGIGHNNISDISVVGSLINLTNIYLSPDSITDVSVFKKLPNLNGMHLCSDIITKEQLQKIQQALPNCNICGYRVMSN